MNPNSKLPTPKGIAFAVLLATRGVALHCLCRAGVSVKLVVLGSPTQGGTMTHAMQAYLKEVPARSLEGVVVAAFDTRFVA